jgi:hypothetical protein
MLNLVRPRYVMPIHGDHKRIRLHAQLAESVGVDPGAIFRGENGLPLEVDASGAGFGAREQSGMIYVDGVEIGDMADAALRDRRMLSADGIFVVVATVSEQDGRSVAPPEIIRGRGPRDRPPPAAPARRPGHVHIRAPPPAPDGAAGRGGGMTRKAHGDEDQLRIVVTARGIDPDALEPVSITDLDPYLRGTHDHWQGHAA